jgi:hypothetical protein
VDDRDVLAWSLSSFSAPLHRFDARCGICGVRKTTDGSGRASRSLRAVHVRAQLAVRAFAPLNPTYFHDVSLLLLRTWNVRCSRGPRLPRLADAEKAAQRARAGCARVRSRHMDVLSGNPGGRERTWRAGCPEGAAVGVHFFWLLFFVQALRRRSGANSGAGPEGAEGRMPGVKKSDPLGRRTSGSSAFASDPLLRRRSGSCCFCNLKRRHPWATGFRQSLPE